MKNDYTQTQNFLKSKKLIADLVKSANFRENNIILDIGAGRGVITDELAKYSNNVIAVEVDEKLFDELHDKFSGSNVNVIKEDFLEYKLPEQPFFVFANIPFNKTADILRKLMSDDSHLDTAYLILQKESALKFAGQQVGAANTMLSIIYGVSFEFSIEYTFSRTDFSPIPSVDAVLLKTKRRKVPLVKESDIRLFKDFVAYLFNKSVPSIRKSKLFTPRQFIRFKKEMSIQDETKPSELSLEQFVAMFKVISITDQVNIFNGYYKKIQNDQLKVEKVHRTRSDKSWRDYSKLS